MIASNITELIGNTPLLKIDPKVHGLKNIELYAKLELFNPFGSLKDRVAQGMLKDDFAAIKKDKKTIIESSSGNTAKAMTILSGMQGIPFKAITNRIKVPEVKSIMQILGADIQEMPGRSECYDPNDPNDPEVFVQREIAENKDKYYYQSQYFSDRNYLSHYRTTGQEIHDDLPQVDFFIGTLGTTGSSRGIISQLKEHNPSLVSVGVAATKDDYIPGIRTIDELYEVGIYKKSLYNEMLFVSSRDAVDAMLRLVRSVGVLGGPTSGACFHGALEYLRTIDETLTEKKVAVFVVCDRMEWYVSYIKARRPDLFGEEQKPGITSLAKADYDNVPTVGPDSVKKWIDEQQTLLIDMRGNISYKASHIPSSINIPDELLEKMIEHNKPFPKAQKILLICPVGNLSKKYAGYLRKSGYDAHSLDGGIVAYRDATLPLVKGAFI